MCGAVELLYEQGRPEVVLQPGLQVVRGAAQNRTAYQTAGASDTADACRAVHVCRPLHY